MADPTPKHAWVESIQGPITLCPGDLLGDWPGIPPGEDWPGRIVVEGVLAVAEVGPAVALLLQTSDYAAWEPLPEGGGVIVQDIAYRGDAAVESLARVPPAAWQSVDETFVAGAPESLLFDGAWAGHEAREGSWMSIALAPGRYRIDVVPELEQARFIRITPV